MKGLLLLAAAGGLYWAYRNGLGALVGACPPGYRVAQDMFPTCRNVLADNITAANVKAQPIGSLPFPWVWAPGANGQWAPVTETPKWPTPAAPAGFSGYRSANYRRVA